jgi:hypothetical protein
MFSRSTDTKPPVDMVFDTKTNTFLEQVPSKQGVKTSNTGDIYVFATGTISIDLLPLFAHCSLGGPTCSFTPISITIGCLFQM